MNRLLTEGISSIIYHFTYFPYLVNIVKEDKFQLTNNLGTRSDLNTSKGKFYFLSTTRSKATGFNNRNVKIVLNGTKLGQKYKAFPIDYWQYSTKPEDYGNMEDPSSKASYINALQSNENEDRIVSDKPLIDNAMSYILETHILIDNNYIRSVNKNDVIWLISEYKNKNIPLYFYSEKRDFLLEDKNKRIDPLELKGYSDETQSKSLENRQGTLSYNLERIAALLSYNDDGNRDKIINDLKLDNHFVESLNDQIVKDKYNYFTYPTNFNIQEYTTAISNSVHNVKTKTSNADRYILKMLVDDLKKWNAKDLSEYIKYKTGYDKQKETVAKNKPQLWDIDGNFEINWNKLASMYFYMEDLWRSLPKKYKSDLNFVKMLNNEKATMAYVYNFLVKNINKEFAIKAFKDAGLEIRKGDVNENNLNRIINEEINNLR